MPESSSRVTLPESLVTQLRDAQTAFNEDASEDNGQRLRTSVATLLELVEPVPGEGEFAFDVTLKAILRVRARSRGHAEMALCEFDSVPIDVTRGPVTITEVTCEQDFTLFQIDGRNV